MKIKFTNLRGLDDWDWKPWLTPWELWKADQIANHYRRHLYWGWWRVTFEKVET